MKETSFIEQNKEKWKKFENMYRSGTGNPDELSRLFIEITEDLSYSRTHYPKRTVRVYLNGLAQQVFTSLYKIRNYPLRRFAQFWTKSLPLEVYRMQRDILFALIVFLIAAAIGVVSTADDISFARVILSNEYINVTEQNIQNNDAMAIYKSGGEFSSFIQIFFNNIQVAFLTFISGILFGIGTLFIVLYNGVMVGTFQSYFYFKGMLIKKALLYSTFLTIWIHGAFEISAIVLAAAAGFTLGRAIMFPGTLTRLQSLQLGARRGLKMMVGLSFFILIAAILEGYVTRHTEMPEWSKLLIILGSFVVMLFLFVFYPWYVAKKYPADATVQHNPAFNPQAEFKLYRVRTFGEMISDTFSLYRRNYKYFYKAIWFIAVPVTILITWFTFADNAYYL
ncbi:MAG: stage II sporulation protein M, partial [Flavobacteriales bacterium]